MKFRSARLPFSIGLAAYILFFVLRTVLPGFQVQSIPYLSTVMYLAVAAGLYLNVSDIDLSELIKNKLAIAAVLCVAVPVKIFIPGMALLTLQPTLGIPVAFLCATVIAHVDPILAARNIAHRQFSPKAGTILRCWSSFDDPITVLFAFYIFMPLFLNEQTSFLSQYFLELLVELLVCIGVATIFRLQKDASIFSSTKIRKLMVIGICVASGLSGRFLLPASLGVMARPFDNQVKERAVNCIFAFSSFLIGALAVGIPLDWWAGIILGGSTFFLAQPAITWLLIQDTRLNRLRVMFGHQNGMTAILLTIALELKTGTDQLLAITLPAIIAIALFYYITNYRVEQIEASQSK